MPVGGRLVVQSEDLSFCDQVCGLSCISYNFHFVPITSRELTTH
jgi:hypothetical protein